MFMFATVSIICGYALDASVLVVPVATLFAITQLRSSMPGAPAGFGTSISCTISWIVKLNSILIGAILGKRGTLLLNHIILIVV